MERFNQTNSRSNSNVKVYEYDSLGRINIYSASQSKSEKEYLEELQKAIEFFEKATKEPTRDNPSKFCFPFYRSFYTIISAKNERQKIKLQNMFQRQKRDR